MKQRQSPLGLGWLLWVFLGALVGVIAGQFVQLLVTGASGSEPMSIGGLLGGAIGALLGNYVGSRMRRRRPK